MELGRFWVYETTEKKYYAAECFINNSENISKFHHTILAPECNQQIIKHDWKHSTISMFVKHEKRRAWKA
jgi:hypothetical protein